jgi:choline-phosphate cytidylyltransferase
MDTASVTSDDDYDVISNPSASASGLRSLDSSLADLRDQQLQHQGKSEPPPTQAAKQQFFTASLSAEEIQAYVHQALLARSTSATTGSQVEAYYAPGAKPVRIYVDGAFDTFNTAYVYSIYNIHITLTMRSI